MLRLHSFEKVWALRLNTHSAMTSLFGQQTALSNPLLGRQSRGPACLQATKRAAASPGGRRTNSNTAVADRPQPSQDLPEVSSVPRPSGVTDGPWDAQDVKAVEEALQHKPTGVGRRQVGQPGRCSFLEHLLLQRPFQIFLFPSFPVYSAGATSLATRRQKNPCLM